MIDDGASVPPIRAMQIVLSQDEDGKSKLDVLDGTFEQVYRLGDAHGRTLFLALGRSKGHLPYRRARQHEATICVRATLAEHDALWSTFLEQDRRLQSQLAEVTRVFVRTQVAPKPG